MLEIGSVPKKGGEGVIYLTTRRFILSSHQHHLHSINAHQTENCQSILVYNYSSCVVGKVPYCLPEASI